MVIVYVKWRDASVEQETNVLAGDIDPGRIMESAGILVKEEKHYLVVAMDSYSADGGEYFNTPGSIPKSSIIDRREISLTAFLRATKKKPRSR